MSKKDQIIKKITEVVNKNAPDSEIYLYGSRARGDAKKFSDWDFLILLNRKNIPFNLETKFMDDIYEIELETGEVISPLIYSLLYWRENQSIIPLFRNIQIEGIRVQ